MIEEDTNGSAGTGYCSGIKCGIAPANLYLHFCVGDVRKAVGGLSIVYDIA